MLFDQHPCDIVNRNEICCNIDLMVFLVPMNNMIHQLVHLKMVCQVVHKILFGFDIQYHTAYYKNSMGFQPIYKHLDVGTYHLGQNVM